LVLSIPPAKLHPSLDIQSQSPNGKLPLSDVKFSASEIPKQDVSRYSRFRRMLLSTNAKVLMSLGMGAGLAIFGKVRGYT